MLHLSTGVIGTRLPLDRVSAGLAALVPGLAATDDGLEAAAIALRTTDATTKVASVTVRLPGPDGAPRPVRVSGIAKGVGMIHPRMATMLSVLLTDAAASPELLASILRPAAARTWNQLSVDGDTSTNDTVFLLASGASEALPVPAGTSAAATLAAAVEAVARDLARQQAADGEGATCLLTSQVTGAADDADARAVARAVVSSSLVKAAAHGKDPNWGRIAGAAGNARLADAAVLEAAGLDPREALTRAGTRRPAGPGPAPDRDRRPSRLRRPGGRSAGVRPGGGARRDVDPRDHDPAGPWPRRRVRRSLRVRPHRGVRSRELGVHDVSEIVVIKLGGTTIADQAQVLAEVASLARRRPVILVHGGGKRLTEWLDRMGVVSQFRGGLRVTDAASLEVAAAVLRGVINSELVSGLRALGVDAVGLSGVDGGLLVAERVEDLGFVARVVGPPARPPRRAHGRRPGAGGRAARPR